MGMRPVDGEYTVKIPLTFDVRGNIKTISQKKIYLSVLIVIAVVLLGLVLSFFGGVGFLFGGLGVALVLQWLLRKFYLQENYFLRKYRELERSKGIFGYEQIWNIYEVEDFRPYICRFADGRKGVFLAFPKDVIIGNGADSEFRHYDAVAQAYSAVSESGLECMHLDYMDVVGKDDRLQGLYDSLDGTSNKDLYRLLHGVFDYIKGRMNEEIASYDVYCFFTRLPDDAFLSALNVIVGYLSRANYLGYYLLDRAEIGGLVESVFNFKDFQVRMACEEVYAKGSHSNFLKVLWSEKDGVRKVYSKRRDEILAEQAVREAEAQVKFKRKFSKDDEEIDLDAE